MNQYIFTEDSILRLQTYILEINSNVNKFINKEVAAKVYLALKNNEYIDFVIKVSEVDGTSKYYKPNCIYKNSIIISGIDKTDNITFKSIKLNLNNDYTFTITSDDETNPLW